MSDYIREAFDGDDVPKKNIALRKVHDEIQRLRAELAARAAPCHIDGCQYDTLDRLRAENARLREALRSIAGNTCCDNCREAALVASAALAEQEKNNV